MITKYLIDKYKSLRKKSYLDKITSYKYKYAFIGVGSHSISNLYPCIKYLNVPLKYICTKNKKTADKMAAGFINCIGTDDLAVILNDDEIKGIFICARSSVQYELTKKCLAAGKNVFVEKPPAFCSGELNDLIKIQGESICVVGLQRRFSPVTKLLNQFKKQDQHYHYRYLTGAYPDGDEVYELFIHPVDNIIQLFGNASIDHIMKSSFNNNTVYNIHFSHDNNINGFVELSTDHSWSSASEYMEINMEKEILQCHYPNSLIGVKKSQTVMNIPLEKLLKQPITQQIYFNNNGFSPIVNNNDLFVKGFYGETEHFINSIEENKKDELTTLVSLKNTYSILDQLKATK
jgi:virulence factor